MTIETLDDDVEFEVENIKSVYDLKKRVKYTFNTENMPFLFHLHPQGKINAASNQGRRLFIF